jgi:hypothetical protein
MVDTGLTIEGAIKIQDEQLAGWKPKLVPKLYEDLVKWAKETNETETDPYRIRRGSDLQFFIINYKFNG